VKRPKAIFTTTKVVTYVAMIDRIRLTYTDEAGPNSSVKVKHEDDEWALVAVDAEKAKAVAEIIVSSLQQGFILEQVAVAYGLTKK